MIKKYFPLLVGAAIIIISLSKIGAGNVVRLVSETQKDLVFLGGILLLLTLFVKASRWTFLLRKIMELDRKTSTAIYFIGQTANEFLPIGSGDLLRTYLAKKKGMTRFGTPLSTIVMERFLDLALLIIIAIFTSNFVFADSFEMYAFTTAFAIAMILFFGVVIMKKNFLLKFILIFKFLKNTFLKLYYTKLTKTIKHFEKANSVYRKKKRALVTAAGISLLGWLFEAINQKILLMAFGFELPLLSMLGVVSISWIVGTFSFLPGGLGTREVSFAYLCSLLGVPLQAAFSMALLYRALAYLFFGILGGLSFQFISKS